MACEHVCKPRLHIDRHQSGALGRVAEVEVLAIGDRAELAHARSHVEHRGVAADDRGLAGAGVEGKQRLHCRRVPGEVETVNEAMLVSAGHSSQGTNEDGGAHG